MHTETQDFINEALAPSICSTEHANVLARAVDEITDEIDAQARVWARKLQAMERVEDAKELRGRIEEMHQTCRALQRQTGEVDDAVRELAKTVRQFERIAGDVAAKAADLGYTVPATVPSTKPE